MRLTYFNSIKVRLELSTQLEQVNFTSFQFHKGAIRTLLNLLFLLLSEVISIP